MLKPPLQRIPLLLSMGPSWGFITPAWWGDETRWAQGTFENPAASGGLSGEKTQTTAKGLEKAFRDCVAPG